MRKTLAMGRAAARCAAVAALMVAGAVLGPVGGVSGAPRPLSFAFSGSGNVTDQGTFGVYGAGVEVTLWSSSGIAAGPLLLTAAAGGAYNWSFGPVGGTLSNLTLFAWLPWAPAVSMTAVFDVSNGTPRTVYAGVNLALPFGAVESLSLASPMPNLLVPRGMTVGAPVVFANTGNVSVGHAGFAVGASSPNLTVTPLGVSSAPAEERPGTSFGFNASFFAPASAGTEDVAATFSVASFSGADLSVPLTVRIVPNRNARVANITTVPSPPDEARAGEIRVGVENTGSDIATATDVRVRVFNATVADLSSNTTRLDLPPNSTTAVVFGWVTPWSQDAITVDASVSTAFDFNASDDARAETMFVNSTNGRPNVTISSPAEGARLSGNVTVAGGAIDPEGGPVSLRFYVDGVQTGAPGTGPSFGFLWNLAVLPDGPHSFTAIATDDRGQETNATVHILVLNRGPNAPPTVVLASPRDGDTVGRNVTLRGSADDERRELASVWVSVDGGPERVANGTFAWNFSWSPPGEGPHALRVRAFDGIEYSAPAFANVTADLTPPSLVLFSGVQVSPPSAVPGANVTVSGTVAFGSGAFASGAQVSAQVQGNTATATAFADDRGGFALDLTAPNAVGSYTVLLAAEGGGAAGNSSTSFAVSTSTLPDLSLLPGSFSIDPDPPPPNTPIHHTITVVNSGSVGATATLRVWDGARSASNLIFESRFTITSQRPAGFDHSYAPGTHNLTIAVEDVAPQDANLADNTLVVSVPVQDAPDFAIESIAPSTRAITAGSNISFLIVVLNSATTGGFVRLEVWDGEPLAPGSLLFHNDTLNIPGGGRERVAASWTPTVGNHTIFALAVFAVPTEIILSNNERNITVEVPGPTAEPSPGFLPGFGGLGALGAATLGAARLRHRRTLQNRRRPRGLAPALGILLLLGFAAALVPAPATSSFSDASNVPGPLNGVCQTCHTDPNGGGALNAFGIDYQAERNASGGNVNWTRLGAVDSDHDAYNNSVELAGSFLPGDPASNPATGVRYSYSDPALLTGLLAVLAVSAVGVWLGVSMLKKRIARKAAEEAQPKAVTPPAPKP